MKETNIRVIFDTNVWINFLIGKRLAFIKSFIVDGKFTIVFTDQLLEEIREVTRRERLKKYFPQELIDLLQTIGKNVEIRPTHFIIEIQKIIFCLT